MFIDLHQDLHRHQRWPISYPIQNQTSIQQLENSDARVIFTTGELSLAESLPTQTQRQVSFYRSQHGWQIVCCKSDLQKCLNNNEFRGFIYHIEGLKSLDSFAETDLLRVLDYLFEAGMRSLSLTHTSNNSFAGGNEGEGKLTDKGKQVIKWCKDNRILVDFAHLNDTSFEQTARHYDQPILVSHANARAISDTGQHRNLTDKQLETIKQSNGLVGLMLSRNFVKVSRQVTIEDVLQQIDYLTNKLGDNSLALGTDFGGCLHEVAIQDLERVSDLPNLYQAVVKSFSKSLADKLFYENAQDWLLKNFGK
jgi:membrane dipeptidase